MGNDYGKINRNRIPSRRKNRSALAVLGVLLGAVLVVAVVIAVMLFCEAGQENNLPDIMPEHDLSLTQGISELPLTPTGSVNQPTGAAQGQKPGETGEPTGGADTTPEPVTPGETPTDTPTEPTEHEKYVVVLDPGHGDRFYGACYNNKYEKTLNLSIALYARAYLEEHYADSLTVYMTRDSDAILDNDQEEDIRLRVEKAAEWGADILVSFHMNATDTHKKNGVEVFCPHRDNVKKEAFRLADEILDEISALGLKRNGYEILRSKKTFDADGNAVEGLLINRYSADHGFVGIIVEHCYMDCETDYPFIQDEAALQALGEADARGIAAYFGLE